MDIYEIRKARSAALRQIETVDMGTREIASLCVYRLKVACVHDYVLCGLKRELKNYNMHTGTWKD